MNKSKHRVANLAFLSQILKFCFFFNMLGDFENKNRQNLAFSQLQRAWIWQNIV